MYLNASQSQALGQLMMWLAEDDAERDIRERVGQCLLTLLQADQFASYVWSDAHQCFEGRVALHMDDGNLRAYEDYFQYRDPITHHLQRQRVPTLVTQVMPQAQLERTEFFNDFLSRDGLCWGVNLYAYHGERNIGDLRIWRARRGGNFDQNALELLALIQPAFTQALVRARGRGAAAPGDACVLTGRERDIAALVCKGVPDKAIARALGIEFSTVRTHLKRIFDKLDVHNRTQMQARLQGGLRH
jgi:DNA-binding CsgD family transcriptional regulator